MVLGKYEYVSIDVDKIVVLPQVRKIKNSKIDEMADSIEDRGLINPLDGAKLGYEELKNHIDFLNQIWKKNINIDSFEMIDGYYYVLIAGHSRLEAIKYNAKKNNRKDEVYLKIHQVKLSEEILAIQLDENIHSEPRIEERAIAIIETYRSGIINNKWKDKFEFIKQNKNKFSRNILNEALVFADLPLKVQEYVFSNIIPYSVGVELGKMFPLIEKYEADFEVSIEQLKKNIITHCNTLLNDLVLAESIKRALAILSGDMATMNDHFRPKEEVQQEMIALWNDGANRQGELHTKQLITENNRSRLRLYRLPFEKMAEIYTLDTNLTGIDHSEELESIRKVYYPHIQKSIFDSH
jgi:hypothetical protein